MAKILRLTEGKSDFPDSNGESITKTAFLAYIEQKTSHGVQIFAHDNHEASIEEFYSFLETGSAQKALGDHFQDNLAKVFIDVWESAMERFFDGLSPEQHKEIETDWWDESLDVFISNVVVDDAYVPFSFPVVFLVPDTAFISPEDTEIYNFETLKFQLGERGFKSPVGKKSPSFRGEDWSEKHVDNFIHYVLDNHLSISVTPIIHAYSVFRFYATQGDAQPVRIKGTPRIFYCYDRERGLGKILVSPKARMFGDFTPNEKGEVPTIYKKDLPGLLDYGPSSLGSIVRTHLWKWQI